MHIKIEQNPHNGGTMCYFQFKGQKYWADKAITFDYGSETMIFKVKDDGEIDWSEEYCDRTGKSIRDCILEFLGLTKEQLDNWDENTRDNKSNEG